MRFALIDRVLEHTPTQGSVGGKLWAIKQVSMAEEYLQDHFPRFPVLPGVMMLEAMVQAGRELLQLENGGEPMPRPMVLGEVRNVRYANMVRPGQALVVEVAMKNAQPDEEGRFEFTGVGTVEGQVAVQGKFSLQPLSDEDYSLSPGSMTGG